MCLGGSISESADPDTIIKRRIGTAWASVRRYNFHLYYCRWNARLSLKIGGFIARREWKLCCTVVPSGLCALRTLTGCTPPTTSYVYASSAFSARTAPDTNPYRMERLSRGPLPNAQKRFFGSANLGSLGLLFGKATQDFQRG